MIGTVRSLRRPLVVAAVFALTLSTPVLSAAASAAGGETCRGEAATFVGTDGSDEFNGGPGRDVVVALGGNDDIDAGDGDDLICAGGGRDEIDGDAGNDRIYGQGGNDEMDGQVGDDVLIGGRGTDDADGEAGDDRCVAEIEEQCES